MEQDIEEHPTFGKVSPATTDDMQAELLERTKAVWRNAQAYCFEKDSKGYRISCYTHGPVIVEGQPDYYALTEGESAIGITSPITYPVLSGTKSPVPNPDNLEFTSFISDRPIYARTPELAQEWKEIANTLSQDDHPLRTSKPDGYDRLLAIVDRIKPEPPSWNAPNVTFYIRSIAFLILDDKERQELKAERQRLEEERRLLEERKASEALTTKRPRHSPMPQVTAQEIRNPAIALADGAYKFHWEECQGETALVHVIPGAPIQTKLTGGALPWWGLTPENANLWNVLTTHGGIPAVLLLFETIGRLMELPPGKSHVRVTLDELAQATGILRRRTTEARLEARKQVYLTLLLLESLEVHGCRNGKWHDPKTGDVLDLRSQDPLIRITGKRMPAQGTLDDSNVPFEVSFTYGEWLERFHGNRQILEDIGDFRRLAAIPTGKATGALAQRIGLALQQKWREQAARVDIKYAGDGNHPTVHLASYFTRQDLCELFRGDPDLKAILDSDDPGRARKYWNDAIKLLGPKKGPTDTEHIGLIGYVKEVDPTPKVGRGISGWQEFWYSQQRLDIRPCQEVTNQIAEVNKAAKNARAARAKRSRKRTDEQTKESS